MRQSRIALATAAGALLVAGCGPKFVQLGENRPAYTREGGRNLGANLVTNHEVDITPLKAVADTYLGVPYVWGGESMTGIDCSAFTRSVWQRTFGIALPRVAKQQSQLGIPVFKFGLQPGDLVFFGETPDSASIDHVGIYMGKNQFINATSSSGVKYSSLDESFWVGKYQFAKRFPNMKLLLDSARIVGMNASTGLGGTTSTSSSAPSGGYSPNPNPRQ